MLNTCKYLREVSLRIDLRVVFFNVFLHLTSPWERLRCTSLLVFLCPLAWNPGDAGARVGTGSTSPNVAKKITKISLVVSDFSKFDHLTECLYPSHSCLLRVKKSLGLCWRADASDASDARAGIPTELTHGIDCKIIFRRTIFSRQQKTYGPSF